MRAGNGGQGERMGGWRLQKKKYGGGGQWGMERELVVNKFSYLTETKQVIISKGYFFYHFTSFVSILYTLQKSYQIGPISLGTVNLIAEAFF